MKIKLAIASLLLFGISSFTVEPKNETEGKNNIQTCDAQCQSTKTTLKASFVSGHLGNYQDCPEDGYRAQPDGASDQSSGISQGDCADDQCGSFNSCEKASAILKLSNGGDNDAIGILVQKIELKDESGSTLATLPLESVTLLDNSQFSGKVGVDDSPSIRVDFQGPVNLSELVSNDEDSTYERIAAPIAIIHITLSADNADDVIVISPVATSLPAVDT